MSEETTIEAPEREESPDVSQVELVRPVDRRVIAGVASGLADYWNVSVGLVRVGFIIASTFGGVGVLLYLAGWLLIPNDDGTESIGEEALRKARSGESWVGVVLIGLAALIGLSAIGNIDAGFAWAIALGVVGYLLYRGDLERAGRDAVGGGEAAAVAGRTASTSGGGRPPRNRTPRAPRPPRPPRAPRAPRERSMLGRYAIAAALVAMGIMALFDNNGYDIAPHHYVGALLAVVASGLLVGTFVGRARWLIVPGLFLLPFAMVTSLADLDWTSEFGENGWVVDGDFERVTVVGADGLDSSYTYEAGDITFDLTEADLLGPLAIELGAGELRVLLPEDVSDLELSIEQGVGEVTVVMVDASDTEYDIQVGIGDIDTLYGDRSGLGLDYDRSGSEGSIEVQLGIGQVNVIGSDGNS